MLSGGEDEFGDFATADLAADEFDEFVGASTPSSGKKPNIFSPVNATFFHTPPPILQPSPTSKLFVRYHDIFILLLHRILSFLSYSRLQHHLLKRCPQRSKLRHQHYKSKSNFFLSSPASYHPLSSLYPIGTSEHTRYEARLTSSKRVSSSHLKMLTKGKRD
jgi:hypothetical protein